MPAYSYVANGNGTPPPSRRMAVPVPYSALAAALMGLALLALVVYSVWQGVKEGGLQTHVTVAPTSTISPAVGPRRMTAPMVGPDPRAKTHWLLMCETVTRWYETREQALRALWDVCGKSAYVFDPIK